MYASPDAAREYRHRHGQAKNGAHREAQSTQGGHVMQDGGSAKTTIEPVRSPVNERVRSTEITSAAPTPNQRVKMAQYSQEHAAGDPAIR